MTTTSTPSGPAKPTPRELTRIAAPCTVKQLLALLAAVEAPEDAVIRPYNGTFRVEAPPAPPRVDGYSTAPAAAAGNDDDDPEVEA